MAKSRAKKSSAESKAQEEKKEGKKRKREAQQEEPVTEEREEKKQRPSRERKQVDRYFEPYPRRVSAPKNPTIEQGPGVKLRDIPNVLFKLSKRKTDDNLHILHTILFRRKSSVTYVKRNILQFSGFVWAENEEKEKAKVKEKLEKCTKDKLLDFCQLFDIPVNKRVTKKEEASEKILEFLESPYISSDVILEEKEQEGKKRKRTKQTTQMAVGEATSDKEEIKKQRRSSKDDVKGRRKQSAKASKDDEDAGDPGDFEENNHVSKPLSRKKSSEKLMPSGPKTKGKTSSVNKGISKSNKSSSQSDRSTSKSNLKASSASQDESKAPAKSKKVSLNEPTRKESKSVAKGKSSLSKKDPVEVSKRVPKSLKKSASDPLSASKSIKVDNKKGHSDDKVDNKKGHGDDKPSTKGKKASKIQTTKPKVSTKEKGKGKVQGKAIERPSREDMLPVVTGILKEADFSVATLADILKQLETHFKVNLTNRKGEVKSIIEEALNLMSDIEDFEEDEGNDEVADDKKVSDDNPEADTEDDPQDESDDGDGDK